MKKIKTNTAGFLVLLTLILGVSSTSLAADKCENENGKIITVYSEECLVPLPSYFECSYSVKSHDHYLSVNTQIYTRQKQTRYVLHKGQKTKLDERILKGSYTQFLFKAHLGKRWKDVPRKDEQKIIENALDQKKCDLARENYFRKKRYLGYKICEVNPDSNFEYTQD